MTKNSDFPPPPLAGEGEVEAAEDRAAEAIEARLQALRDRGVIPEYECEEHGRRSVEGEGAEEVCVHCQDNGMRGDLIGLDLIEESYAMARAAIAAMQRTGGNKSNDTDSHVKARIDTEQERAGGGGALREAIARIIGCESKASYGQAYDCADRVLALVAPRQATFYHHPFCNFDRRKPIGGTLDDDGKPEDCNCIGWIEAGVAPRQGEWIKTSERLPNDSVRVLIATDAAVGEAGYDHLAECWRWSRGWGIPEPTHWRPLPTPPADAPKPEGMT